MEVAILITVVMILILFFIFCLCIVEVIPVRELIVKRYGKGECEKRRLLESYSKFIQKRHPNYFFHEVVESSLDEFLYLENKNK